MSKIDFGNFDAVVNLYAEMNDGFLEYRFNTTETKDKLLNMSVKKTIDFVLDRCDVRNIAGENTHKTVNDMIAQNPSYRVEMYDDILNVEKDPSTGIVQMDHRDNLMSNSEYWKKVNHDGKEFYLSEIIIKEKDAITGNQIHYNK